MASIDTGYNNKSSTPNEPSEETKTEYGFPTTKGLSLININIRSLLSKQEQIECLLSTEIVGVLNLSETWLNKSTPTDRIRVANYKIYRHDRELKKRGGGLCVYIHKKLKVDAQKYSTLNLSNKTIEIFILEVSQKSTRPFILISVYRPPQGKTGEFIDQIRFVLNNIPAGSDLFLMGDFNINYLEESIPKRELKNLEKEFNLKQQVVAPTRYTKKSRTLIDHIYTNYTNVSDSGVLDCHISDHLPTYVTIKKAKQIYERTTFTCRNIKGLDEDLLAERLREVDWKVYYDYMDPEMCWDYLLSVMIKILDDMCPERTFRNVKKKSKWINSSLFELMRDREDKFKIARRSNDHDDWEAARKARNLANEQCRYAKSEYIKSKLAEYSGNTKKFWEYLKPIISDKEKSQEEKIELEDARGNEPEVFNQFFANVGVDLQKQIPPLLANELNEAEDQEKTKKKKCTFEFRNIIDIEVIEIVKNIKIHKSSGIPKVSSHLLKLCFKHLIQQLTFMLNLSIKTSKIPVGWKKATITPVFKAGDPRVPGNYRPISTLPLTTKILEKCIHIQLSKYLESNNLLTDKQFGFRKSLSTTKAIHTFLTDIYTGINNKWFTKICYIDLKKAFDTVSHPILYQKLELLGITNHSLDWFKDYLTNREQCVKVNGCVSGGAAVQCGVPQGSTLGPLLFLIYINDVIDTIQAGTLLFADDTVIYTMDKSYDQAVIKLQKCIDKFMVWTKKSKLTVNISKSKTMTVEPTRQVRESKMDISMGGKMLDEVSIYRYLGVKIDSSLTFKTHVNGIIKNVSHKIYQLGKIRKYLTVKASEMVYKSTILPLFDVGDTFYDSASKALLNKLQNLQNRALRLIFKLDRRANTDKVQAEVHLIKLEERRALHIIQLAKWLSEDAANLDKRTLPTRSHIEERKNLSTFRPNNQRCLQSCFYKTAKYWNQLPTLLHSNLKREKFKNLVTDYIVEGNLRMEI